MMILIAVNCSTVSYNTGQYQDGKTLGKGELEFCVALLPAIGYASGGNVSGGGSILYGWDWRDEEWTIESRVRTIELALPVCYHFSRHHALLFGSRALSVHSFCPV